MTAIIAILGLGLIVWAATVLVARLPAPARLPLGIAIMLGLTGYLLVGQPGAAGVPVRPLDNAEPAGFGEEMEAPRQGMTGNGGDSASMLAMADGMMRTNRFRSAATILDAATRREPRNIDLWVAYGNALIAHDGGVMTPAAAMAFDKAADIDPSHPAPPFFAGLALAQGGDIEGARVIWQQLLARTPPDAPWREDLTNRLSQLPPAAVPAAPAAAPAGPAPQGN
jgi:cytochrome c-type biogenesis protein CcmH